MFAIGFADGTVHIRKITNIVILPQKIVRNRQFQNDEPHVRIERGSEPVWALSFSITHIPSDMAYKNSVEESIPEILTISDWNKTLAFYDTNGAKVTTDFPIIFNGIKNSAHHQRQTPKLYSELHEVLQQWAISGDRGHQ